MFDSSQYELLDIGSGRKLERFGLYVLDRPAPAAADEGFAHPELWSDISARFETDARQKSGPARGQWTTPRDLPAAWTIRHGVLAMEIKPTEFGHLGLFPEQATCWDWIDRQLRGTASAQVLNLFAYTGGSTLAGAAAGAAVTHVDAAENTVAWARRNASLSGLAEAPVRWIVDDVMKFARRELRRGRHYDAVILDPPSYGHGAGGETWQIDEHLPELLSICRELTAPQARFVLLTCHAPAYDAARLGECLATAGFGERPAKIETGDLWLSAADGRRLHSGVFARTGS